jgi:hypothetical protein
MKRRWWMRRLCGRVWLLEKGAGLSHIVCTMAFLVFLYGVWLRGCGWEASMLITRVFRVACFGFLCDDT